MPGQAGTAGREAAHVAPPWDSRRCRRQVGREGSHGSTGDWGLPGRVTASRDLANKGPSHQGYGFSSGHVWM